MSGKTCVLEVRDEVNVKFHNLDITTRRKLADACTYFLPHARFTPAFKLGRWDGKVRFCDSGGRSYIYLLDQLLPIIEEDGYDVELVDNREYGLFEFDFVDVNSVSDIKWPKGHDRAGESIILRDHQVDIINSFLEHDKGLQSISTGGGKTLVTAVLSQKVEKYGRSLVIVPNKSLVTQTEKDYKNLGLDVGVYYGDRKEVNRTHIIATWQSLESLHKQKRTKEGYEFSDIADGCVCVILDEAHKGKANVIRKLLGGPLANVPLRWGLTGTVPKEAWEAIPIFSCIGPPINKVTAKELQDKGILSNLHINILQLKDLVDDFGSYHSESEWLLSNNDRLKFISEHVKKESLNGNTLVLVDKIATGKKLSKLLGCEFVYGNTSADDRDEFYQRFQDNDDEVLVASFGVASTGIDIPRVFNLYLIEPGKSFVRVIQSVGRGIRRAKDKDHVEVFDITSTAKYSKRHLRERKKFYKEAEYPFTVTKVDYL